LKVIYKLM